jgi:hypothetical protein
LIRLDEAYKGFPPWWRSDVHNYKRLAEGQQQGPGKIVIEMALIIGLSWVRDPLPLFKGAWLFQLPTPQSGSNTTILGIM